MKITVVPAQVTSIEDRVAGNLGVSQLLLLAGPIFISSALFVVLPPFFHGAPYKLVIITLLFIVGGLLAVRVKGTIVLLWLITVVRYNLRPRFYVFDKRSLHGREEYEDSRPLVIENDAEPLANDTRLTPALSTAETIALQNIMENPAAHLSFETNKKGRLYVCITEIKPEV